MRYFFLKLSDSYIHNLILFCMNDYDYRKPWQCFKKNVVHRPLDFQIHSTSEVGFTIIDKSDPGVGQNKHVIKTLREEGTTKFFPS